MQWNQKQNTALIRTERRKQSNYFKQDNLKIYFAKSLKSAISLNCVFYSLKRTLMPKLFYYYMLGWNEVNTVSK